MSDRRAIKRLIKEAVRYADLSRGEVGVHEVIETFFCEHLDTQLAAKDALIAAMVDYLERTWHGEEAMIEAIDHLRRMAEGAKSPPVEPTP